MLTARHPHATHNTAGKANQETHPQHQQGRAVSFSQTKSPGTAPAQHPHTPTTQRAATVLPCTPARTPATSIGPSGRAVCAAPDLTPTTRGRDQERRRRQIKKNRVSDPSGGNHRGTLPHSPRDSPDV